MACVRCGAERAKLMAQGGCINVAGCERRRLTRRVEMDRKRGGRQCMVATSYGTAIYFCLMREFHKGRCTDGSREWSRKDETATGRLFAKVLRPTGNVSRAR
jgi:hypothetical protein